jgi:hypothetical protein
MSTPATQPTAIQTADEKRAAAMEGLKKLADLLPRAFITCTSGDGDPYVTLQFRDLKDAQDCHAILVGRADLVGQDAVPCDDCGHLISPNDHLEPNVCQSCEDAKGESR